MEVSRRRSAGRSPCSWCSPTSAYGWGLNGRTVGQGRAGPAGGAAATAATSRRSGPSPGRCSTSSSCRGSSGPWSSRKNASRAGPAPGHGRHLRLGAPAVAPGRSPRGPGGVIVSRRAGRLVLVRQVDHQDQCGLMADAWGNGRFGRPEPFGPARARRAGPRRGLARLGGRARRSGPTGRRSTSPTSTGPSTSPSTATASRGRRPATPAAGLLVSLHGQGLYEGRRGLDPGPRDPAVASASRRCRRSSPSRTRSRRVCAPASAGGPALEELELGGLPAAADVGRHEPVPHLGDAVGPRAATLPQVPRRVGRRGRRRCGCGRPGTGRVACDPWPFGGDAVNLPVAARTVPGRPLRARPATWPPRSPRRRGSRASSGYGPPEGSPRTRTSCRRPSCYACCEAARAHRSTATRVGRVIARPFAGRAGRLRAHRRAARLGAGAARAHGPRRPGRRRGAVGGRRQGRPAVRRARAHRRPPHGRRRATGMRTVDDPARRDGRGPGAGEPARPRHPLRPPQRRGRATRRACSASTRASTRCWRRCGPGDLPSW